MATSLTTLLAVVRPAARRSFTGSRWPARPQVSGYPPYLWLTIDDRDLPSVLARLWHGAVLTAVAGKMLCDGLEGDRVDLDELERVASERVRAWRAAAVRWEIIRWSATDKPAASFRVERDGALAELILWVSGEAELTHVRGDQDEPVSKHYEITTELGLRGCIDDLERHIGL
jgi:hypothetical protein